MNSHQTCWTCGAFNFAIVNYTDLDEGGRADFVCGSTWIRKRTETKWKNIRGCGHESSKELEAAVTQFNESAENYGEAARKLDEASDNYAKAEASFISETEASRAEIARLRAENERLNTALSKCRRLGDYEIETRFMTGDSLAVTLKTVISNMVTTADHALRFKPEEKKAT
jgi:hypothetical protein